jgi:serine/threonine protein kinase
MLPLSPGRRIERYEVVRPLGQGGMAVVVEVRHVDLGTRHALKVLQIHAPWLHERLLTEGRIQARLRGKHVCRVTDVVRVGEAPGLVMELVDGPPLESMLTTYQPNLGQIDHLARGILSGIRVAHDAGLVHRDLKPANVLLEITDTEIVPKVADYGLAKTLGELGSSGRDNTRSGVTLGTPSYMAPEQFRNAKHADQRADQFSLGCLLYELVSGLRPFPGETPIEVYEAAQAGRFRPLRDVAPNVPRRMADAITRALQPHPDARFPDCAAFAEVWCDGIEDEELEGVWEPEHLALVRSLAPHTPLVHSTDSMQEHPPTLEAPAPSGPTAIPDLPPPPSTERTGSPVDTTTPPLPPLASRTGFSSELLSTPGARWAGVAGLSVLGMLSGLVVALMLGVILIGGIWWSSTPREVRPPAPEPAPASAAPAPEEPPAPAPSLSPVTPQPPRPAPVAPTEPVPVPVPVPEPAPALESNDATVEVSGIERAWLIDSAGVRFKPGKVPPGEYNVQVFFEPSRATRVLALELAPREHREIKCDMVLRVCR